MTSQSQTAVDSVLLRDLMDGLSIAGGDSALAVGVVGSAAYPAQPPAHCLRRCLGNSAGAIGRLGCPFLVSAARNVIDATSLRDGSCVRGYRVAAQETTVAGGPAVLLSVEGKLGLPAGLPETEGGVDLLPHLASASRLVQRVGQLLEENSGFANELLQNYEQLNLIFDLAQQIAQVTDTIAIERLLLERVARLLSAAAVWVVTTDGQYRAVEMGAEAGQSVPPPAALDLTGTSEMVAAVQRTRQVQVGALDHRPVIAGPLVRLDDQVDVVLAVGGAGRAAFTAGDMMVVESVLAFGGQIISNSELNERLRQMSFEVTRALVAAIDKKDHYTSGHSERVGFLTRLTAQEFGLRGTELRIMEWAGLLHDIGKIGIPEEILCKPGKLTKEEFEVIQRHPRMGYDILKPIASFGLVLDGVLSHHEQPNGGGYPQGLAGDQIPLVARIIHVVDTFDASTSTRSYRQAFRLEKALEIIRTEQGVRIDREAADTFFRTFATYRRDDAEDFAARFSAIQEREFEHAVV